MTHQNETIPNDPPGVGTTAPKHSAEHSARQAGRTSAHRAGNLLAAAVRGLASGTANATAKFFLDHTDLGE